MSLSNLRNSFLNQIWLPYPAMPENLSLAGRITDISEQSINVDGQEYKLSTRVSLQPCKAEFNIAASELNSVLRRSDLVALSISNAMINEIWFLAPALVKPIESSASEPYLVQWRDFLNRIRLFFSDRNFLEVSTPTLVECPGTEPFLDLFSTDFCSGKLTKKYFLPTSPELHLKKMLALGYRQIFEMRPCFRNGEISPTHQPEFWMLEWYRAYSRLDEIQKDVSQLLTHLTGSELKFDVKSMSDLFREALNFNLTPTTSFAELRALALDLNLRVENFDSWDDIFYFIFVEKIERNLGLQNPLFVNKYPPSQAALARLTEDGWGDRFELYWRGLEIANAFHELNDPEIQKLRFQSDLDKKKSLQKQIPELDSEFQQALESGMPPSGGIALGLERLFMALYGLQNIDKTRVFAISKND